MKTYDVSYTAQPASSIILGLMRIDGSRRRADPHAGR